MEKDFNKLKAQNLCYDEIAQVLNKTAFDLQCQATENQQYREVLEKIKPYPISGHITSLIRNVLSLNRAEIKLTTGEE